MLHDQLNALTENLGFLAVKPSFTMEEVEKFEQDYLKQLKTKHGKITPTQTDSNERKDINKIYVCPSFLPLAASERSENNALVVPIFLSSISRAVILGDPGGGKSTFTQKVCYDIATMYDQRPFANRKVTPFLVILREYGRRKVQQQCSILDFIVSMLNSDYQTPVKPEIVEYMLHNGRAVVIFDGLDELTDTNDRQNIRDDVEAFCSRYSFVPVLVTSRFVGYEQAPLDEEAFLRFRLASFNEEQVKEYVEKWFGAVWNLSADDQRKKINTFLEESASVPDLRSNPLMLALMCSIYRDEGTIPNNRPEVYEECATMLFDKWDKRRKIVVPLAAAVQMRPTLEYLAHCIYSDKALQEGVAERDLVDRTTDFLHIYYKDREEAKIAAQGFTHYCRDRAWVFTNTGSTGWNQELYQFTHRTFLEYFTAQYLVRTNETTEELTKLLLPRVAKQEWDVVAQLAIQRKSKMTEGATDKILLALLQAAERMSGEERAILASFSVRCLEFLTPSYQTVADVTRACLEYLAVEATYRKKYTFDKEQNHRRAMFHHLLRCMAANRLAVRNTLEKYLLDWIDQEDNNTSVRAAEIILYMRSVYEDEDGNRLGEEAIIFWNGLSEQLCSDIAERLRELAKQQWGICRSLVWNGKVALSEFVEWHGMKSLFLGADINVFSLRFMSLVSSLTIDALYVPKSGTKVVNSSTPALLSQLGKLCQYCEIPYVDKSECNIILPGVDAKLPSTPGQTHLKM